MIWSYENKKECQKKDYRKKFGKELHSDDRKEEGRWIQEKSEMDARDLKKYIAG